MYAKSLACIVLFLAGILSWADDVPVAPLSRGEHPVYGDVYHLKNDVMDLLVSPAEGGIVALRILSSSNLLSAPLRMLPDSDPDRVLAAIPRLEGHPLVSWDARAWKNGDGSKVVMLTKTFSPPLSLRVTQVIRLESSGANLDWEGRFTATGVTTRDIIPLMEWQPSRPDWTTWTGTERLCETNPFPATCQVFTEQQDLLCRWEACWQTETPVELAASVPPRWQKVESTGAWNLLAPVQADLPPVGWTRIFHLVFAAHPRQADQTACEQALAWVRDKPTPGSLNLPISLEPGP